MHDLDLVPAPAPLAHAELYILLALTGQPRHAYSLQSAAINLSLGGLKLGNGHLHRVLMRLAEDGLISAAELAPAGPSGQERRIISITEWGLSRLNDDLTRICHVVDVAREAGLLEPEIA